jgi:hypothetical protein
MTYQNNLDVIPRYWFDLVSIEFGKEGIFENSKASVDSFTQNPSTNPLRH